MMDRERLAGHIRIAKFMGTQYDLLNPLTQYDSDWNAMVPVIEKIESLHRYGFDVFITSGHTIIEMFRESDDAICSEPVKVASYSIGSLSRKRISHTYGAVLAFLDWLDSRATDTDLNEPLT